MGKKKPSQTAIGTSIYRAAHQILDGEPKILNDLISIGLVEGSTEKEIRAQAEELQHPRRAQSRSRNVIRSRFAEDQLAEAFKDGIRQYIILGAGLDTFAYRQPDWASELLVIEVDQPASQQYKIECLKKRDISIPANTLFCPVDFEHTSLAEGLEKTDFDFQEPTFISWLGVTQYLTRPAIESVFHFVLSLPSSSRIVFTFRLWVPQGTAGGGMNLVGEPRISHFEPEEMLKWLDELGFSHVFHLTPQLCEKLYFSGRTDALPISHAAQSMCAFV